LKRFDRERWRVGAEGEMEKDRRRGRERRSDGKREGLRLDYRMSCFD